MYAKLEGANIAVREKKYFLMMLPRTCLTHNNVKGKPNLTVRGFCEWVNNDLLDNETLETGYPRKIGLETARKWMHELGFEVVTKKKGTFVDGHEREDVVDYHKKFYVKW